jgi:hypothetical protein
MTENSVPLPDKDKDYTFIYIRKEDKERLKAIAASQKRSLIDQMSVLVNGWAG